MAFDDAGMQLGTSALLAAFPSLRSLDVAITPWAHVLPLVTAFAQVTDLHVHLNGHDHVHEGLRMSTDSVPPLPHLSNLHLTVGLGCVCGAMNIFTELKRRTHNAERVELTTTLHQRDLWQALPQDLGEWIDTLRLDLVRSLNFTISPASHVHHRSAFHLGAPLRSSSSAFRACGISPLCGVT